MNRIQSNTLQLVAAMAGDAPADLVYEDCDGVVSIRTVKVLSIERCQNGQTVARCYDLHRDAPRCFRLTGVQNVNPLAVVVVA